MNWLAHLFLSEPDTEFRLGNVLADSIKRHDRASMPPNFQRGIHQHLKIDAFTDTHPIVRRSRSRLTGDYRHTRGILIDIFYDHLLALNWLRYCPQTLESFATSFYAAVRPCPIELPADARGVLDYILDEDKLCSYRSLDGIHATLIRLSRRLSHRLGKSISLERATTDLRKNFDALQADFAEFFPDLQNHLCLQ